MYYYNFQITQAISSLPIIFRFFIIIITLNLMTHKLLNSIFRFRHINISKKIICLTIRCKKKKKRWFLFKKNTGYSLNGIIKNIIILKYGY